MAAVHFVLLFISVYGITTAFAQLAWAGFGPRYDPTMLIPQQAYYVLRAIALALLSIAARYLSVTLGG
jgi:hypothetical protein